MDVEKVMELRDRVQSFVKWFGILEQHTTPCGYPLSVSQVFALQELEKQSHSIHSLAQYLRLERSTVSRLIDRLVKEEFVSRKTNPHNRRQVDLSLTRKGKKVIQQVQEQAIGYYREVMEERTEKEQEQILLGLRLFTDSLKKHQIKGGDQDERE